MSDLVPWLGWAAFGFFALITFIQLFYYLYFFRKLAFYKQPEFVKEQQQPVSVVICARDEAGNLVKNLPGVLFQEYPATHEVILVNDNSTDETKYVIEEFKKSFKQINPIDLSQEAKLITGKKFPLSMGIKSAKHETILLTDADCVPATEFWIQKMQSAYVEGKEIVLGYGAYHKKKGFLNKLIRFETFLSALQYLSFALQGLPYMGVGRNLSYKRDVFIRNKGFSSINMIPGGDDDLFINQVATAENTAIMIDHEAHTWSEPKKTWSAWMQQKYRHYTTSKYYKPIHKFLLGLFSSSQFLFYPAMAAAIIFHIWWWALIAFGIRLIVQAIIWFNAMKKLNESDLWPWFLFFDIWQFFYSLLMFPALFKQPKKTWN